uniref:Protein S-acyltransferase n=1 Tax=Acrobeloides nanus TaxID=290746 RepID=A0A914CH80_9BILA
MIYVFSLALSYVIIKRDDLFTRPTLCALVLIAICAFLCVPVVGLTGFHMVLVFRARTTNEQVTGKFRSGFNPFTIGCWGNLQRTVCSSQFPSYQNRYARTKNVRNEENLTVLYVPESELNKDGHIRMKKTIEDGGSIGTALSVGANSAMFSKDRRNQQGSACNLYDEDEDDSSMSRKNAYEESVREGKHFIHV